MPRLDVSFMTSDPMLADTFTVIRRLDVVGLDGRTTPTEEDRFPGTVGVVTQQDPADLMRREDAQLVPRSIFIASTFAFYNACVVEGKQYQPDIIEWDGTSYAVRQVYPYSRFGGGTFECVAESMAAVDTGVQTGRGSGC